MSNTIPVTLDYIKELYPLAKKNGTLDKWAGIILIWSEQAEKEIHRLQKIKECNHTIVDCRNEIITNGYMCTECNALFAAGDH